MSFSQFTGFGIVSGEKYVYEADINNSYHHKNASHCHNTCVKLLRLLSSPDLSQSLDLHGVTFMDPPYHSFVIYGDEDDIKMRVEGFKMVGAWYWQTDGLELYTNGEMKNTFLHSNDDVLKIYHDNVNINNTVIWKSENGPVIQWGWAPRNIDNIRVSNTYVIHNKMYWTDVKGNTCIINSSPPWTTDPSAGPNNDTNVVNIVLENLHVEGTTNCAIRIYALSNTKSIYIKNFSIDAWNELDVSSQASKFSKLASNLVICSHKTCGTSLKLENYSVNGERIIKSSGNWDLRSLGRLDFDKELFDCWDAV